MFDKIKHPVTNKWINIDSKSGQRVIGKYLSQVGGIQLKGPGKKYITDILKLVINPTTNEIWEISAFGYDNALLQIFMLGIASITNDEVRDTPDNWSEKELREIWRALSLKTHPDRNIGNADNAGKAQGWLKAAYEYLTDKAEEIERRHQADGTRPKPVLTCDQALRQLYNDPYDGDVWDSWVATAREVCKPGDVEQHPRFKDMQEMEMSARGIPPKPKASPREPSHEESPREPSHEESPSEPSHEESPHFTEVINHMHKLMTNPKTGEYWLKRTARWNEAVLRIFNLGRAAITNVAKKNRPEKWGNRERIEIYDAVYENMSRDMARGTIDERIRAYNARKWVNFANDLIANMLLKWTAEPGQSSTWSTSDGFFGMNQSLLATSRANTAAKRNATKSGKRV